MNGIRGIFRLLHLLAHMAKGLFLSYLKLHGTQSHDLTTSQHQVIQNWLHRSAEIIGIEIQVQGQLDKTPAFIVANHISWLDIIIISSILPVSFLSKAEIRYWPVIGTLAAKAGTLFIHRGRSSGEAIDLMNVKLTAGHNVVSFPEAKTTDGTSVAIFHPRLFATAIETRSMIQPLALRYPKMHIEDNNKPQDENYVNPLIPYLEEPNLIKHAFRIMCAKKTIAHVTFCEPIKPEQKRKQLAQAAQEAIAKVVIET